MHQRPLSHRFSALLAWWFPRRLDGTWVLASLFDTRGSAYRKSGAQFFINDLGQGFGLISGGCLEADIIRLAQRVFEDGETREHIFDPQEKDESVSAKTGCGGTLTVRLQILNEANAFLDLGAVHAAVEARQSGHWWQSTAPGVAQAFWQATSTRLPFSARATLQQREDGLWLATPLDLPPHLLIVGGGVDARPLAALAQAVGWQVSVCDPRAHAARRSDFPEAAQLYAGFPRDLDDFDAAVVMTHNLDLDAEALRVLRAARHLRYLALLGPAHRRETVLANAGLQAHDFCCALAGPAGLRLGADLPESVALSILAEAHAVLYGSDGGSFCNLLSGART